jgi:uncharacterized protein YdeI (YjbR/CyaY-like superfamily)
VYTLFYNSQLTTELAMKEDTRDPRVDAYIEKAAPFAQPILNHLRKLMHQACPRANESIKWGMPFFVQQGIVLAHMAAFKNHCAFGFWGPQMKKALAREGLHSSDAMGTLGRITATKDLPPDQEMLGYMHLAGELVESGQRKKSIERPAKKKAKPPVKIPTALAAALKKNKTAAKTFEKFSESCRREYAVWIDEAKRSETRAKRVEQAVVWIAQGKSRNWKYQTS